MVHYKLHYFKNVGGRGEFIRQIFAQSGTEFEENQVDFQEWPQQKANYPNGQLPVLEVDGQVLAQSYAIGRYLAKKFGLAGKDDWEAAKADMYVYGIEDVLIKMFPFLGALILGKGDKDEELAKIKPDILLPFVAKYEKALKDNGGEYFVGKHLTWADIVIADFLERLSWHDGHLLDGHDTLKEFIHRIHDLPNIKKHIASRPQMKF